ncbi:MAG: rsfS [Dehalococcoidia bacterium]|nr:rsfS [Dehalococcoidia bacterium]
MMLDIRGVSSFADYFVICSGQTQRQLQAILDEMDVALEKVGAPVLHREGTVDSGWVLLDFGSVVVHLFSPWEREYYSLDRLWQDGVQVLRIQ